MRYNWQHPHWPSFFVQKDKALVDLLDSTLSLLNIFKGLLLSLDKGLCDETSLLFFEEEVLGTLNIEGENLDPEILRSSLKKQLGLGDDRYHNRQARNMAALMTSIRHDYHKPLTEKHLWRFHGYVMEGSSLPIIGTWRTSCEPMQIVGGAMGHEKVYFEAPPSHSLPFEMERFIHWSNSALEYNKSDQMIHCALSHLYFESLHPFLDGNGRVGRALVGRLICAIAHYPLPLSLSKILYKRRNAYYNALHKASTYTMDVTEWVHFFISCLNETLEDSQKTLLFVLKKKHFWSIFQTQLNERQTHVIERMFKEGKEGFKGGMSARKYMIITGCSKATATRDLSDLVQKSCFVPLSKGGRSQAYELKI